MRDRILLAVVVAIVAATVLVGTAASVPSSAASGVTATIPLPALNADEVKGVTVKATALPGKKLGPLVVKTANETALGNESIVFVVQGPHGTGTSGVYTVYALIKRFGSVRNAAAAADEGDILSMTMNTAGLRLTGPVKDYTGDCDALSVFNTAFEKGARQIVAPIRGLARSFNLFRGRIQSTQTSDPEEVLDQIVDDVWGSCPGAPEPFDSGAN